jgi:site-specific recombinase XerD
VKNDIAKLADVLGHSSIETTRIYIRTTSDEYRTQMNRLGLVCRS